MMHSGVEVDGLARRAAAAVDADGVIALTRELVRIRSVFEPKAGNTEAAAAHAVAGVVRGMGLTVRVEEAAPGRPNVIADWQGSTFGEGGKTLLFEGHSDVVTEGDAGGWRHPPFSGVLEAGRVYGRGAADMKGGVAAAIGALAAVIKTAPELPGRIRLGVVADEEGMMLGIKDFIRRGWAQGVDGAIICEPEENEICLFQKGAMRVGVTSRGVMAHGAMPYAGVNPIPPLADFIRAVGELEAQEQARLGAHDYLGLPWITPTTLQAPLAGEPQVNVMPESAYLALDVRTVPGQDHEALFASLQRVADGLNTRVKGPAELRLELIEARPWTETPPEDPLARAVARAYRQTLGREPVYGGVPGATDGTFLHAWAGVAIVTVGPGDRTIPHQRDECVSTAALVEAARLYAATAIYFLSPDS